MTLSNIAQLRLHSQLYHPDKDPTAICLVVELSLIPLTVFLIILDASLLNLSKSSPSTLAIVDTRLTFASKK